MKLKSCFLFTVLMMSLLSCNDDDASQEPFGLKQAFMGSTAISIDGSETTEGLPVDKPITLIFTGALDETSLPFAISLTSDSKDVAFEATLSAQNTVLIHPATLLESSTVYTLSISEQLHGAGGGSATAVSFSFKTKPEDLELLSVVIDGNNIGQKSLATNVKVNPTFTFNFSGPVDMESFEEALQISGTVAPVITSEDGKMVSVTSSNTLEFLKKYNLELLETLRGAHNEPFSGYEFTFYTQLDSTYKFPEITDEELLTKVQEQTFKYFWDFAHPTSGLASERNTSGDVVTIGGSGFGVMTILVGIERGFITRQQGMDRLETIVDFLSTADRFHGVWPHWVNGNTGEVIPFSQKDDGADLVETAFMIQGLLTVREYLNDADAQEAVIKSAITQLWEAVEWDWFTREGEEVLYWHWSPNYGWDMDHQISGWNESLIVYVLAASSPTHAIDAEVYHKGWAGNGEMQNGNEYYGIELPVGSAYGGPLFFAHYSFLGLDPRNLEDQYANYWIQNVNHTSINRMHCIANPKDYVGYSNASWGLTASDNHEGYSAHSPDNDLGVITPTAAISSMPYTPEYSMEAIKHFYYLLGDKLWGTYGFYDAFNFTQEWTASSYLAIDQGPIVIMIENYRTALLWDLFMANNEIENGLDKLSFTSY